MSGESFEIVIAPEEGYEKEHAELHRKNLINHGYHGDVVEVQERSGE